MLGSALLPLVKLPLREQSLNADNNRAMDLKHAFILESNSKNGILRRFSVRYPYHSNLALLKCQVKKMFSSQFQAV